MPFATLDFPDRKILIEANTEIERTYRAHACAKEPWTVDFIRAIPAGSVFHDVGANVGPYTLIAAALGILTVAIEPSVINHATLVRNAMRNGLLERIIPVNAALANQTALLWFDYAGSGAAPGFTGTGSGEAGHVLGSARKLRTHRQGMMAWRLDDLVERFLQQPPTHLKVDVDGGELAVLEGMEHTLRSGVVQGIMLEMPLADEAALTAWLAQRGYQLAERFDQRNGQTIGNICYGRFARATDCSSNEVAPGTLAAA